MRTLGKWAMLHLPYRWHWSQTNNQPNTVSVVLAIIRLNSHLLIFDASPHNRCCLISNGDRTTHFECVWRTLHHNPNIQFNSIYTFNSKIRWYLIECLLCWILFGNNNFGMLFAASAWYLFCFVRYLQMYIWTHTYTLNIFIGIKFIPGDCKLWNPWPRCACVGLIFFYMFAWMKVICGQCSLCCQLMEQKLLFKSHLKAKLNISIPNTKLRAKQNCVSCMFLSHRWILNSEL